MCSLVFLRSKEGPLFSSVSQTNLWLICDWFYCVVYQYPFSGNVPFPHSVGLHSTAIVLPCDISFSPRLNGPGTSTWPKQDQIFVCLFVFPGNFGRGWWGRKREQRKQKKNPIFLPWDTAPCCVILWGARRSHVDWETARKMKQIRREKMEAETFSVFFTIPSLVLFLRLTGLCRGWLWLASRNCHQQTST